MSAMPTVAPFSQEAEEAVLGAVLINPDSWLELTFLQPDDFFILRHRIMWAALGRLVDRHETPDFLTVQEELKAMGSLKDVGGPAWILSLINNTPTSVHAPVYAQLVRRQSVRRRLIAAGAELQRLATAEDLALEDVIDQAQRQVFTVMDSAADSRHEHTMPEMVGTMLDRIEDQMNNPGNSPALPSGYRELDTILDGGLWRGDLIVVAGRPGMGKTAFLLGVAMNAARVGARVGITSLEMNDQALMVRMAAMETGIPISKLRTGKLAPDEWRRLLPASDAMNHLEIMTNDAPAQTVAQIQANVRRWQMRMGLDLVIVDYLGLLHSADLPRRKEDNRVLEIDRMTRELKELARDLNVPVLVAAQVNRQVENRQDKRPMLSDLRESGGIEANSDVVAFLYRDVVYDQETENPNKAEVIVAKHRNGATDTAFLIYNGGLTRFENGRRETIDLAVLA